MKGPHDYNTDCQCYKCKGIRNAPARFAAPAKRRAYRERRASREEQNARYIDCGPQNWDDRDSPSGDY